MKWSFVRLVKLARAVMCVFLTVGCVYTAHALERDDRAGRRSFGELMPFMCLEFSYNNEQSLIAARTHFSMAIYFRQNLRYEDALTELNLALRLHPRCAPMYLYAADIYVLCDKIDEAVECLNSALSCDPAYTQAHMRLAQLYAELGNAQQAIDEYRQVIARAPDNTLAYQELAKALSKRQLNEQAIEVYRTVLRHDSTQPYIWYELGMEYARVNQVDEAIEAFLRSIELDNSLYLAHLSVAVLYDERLGNYKKAVMYYTACENIHPNPRVQQRLEQLKINQAADDDVKRTIDKTELSLPDKLGFLNSATPVR